MITPVIKTDINVVSDLESLNTLNLAVNQEDLKALKSNLEEQISLVKVQLLNLQKDTAYE